MNLDRGKSELANDIGVLDRECLFNGLAFHPFGGEGRTGNRGATPKGLKSGFFNDLRFGVDTHLQLHAVTAFRSAYETSPDIGILFRKAPNVTRIVVVVYYFIAISHESFSSGALQPFSRKAANTEINCSARDCRC